MVTVHSAEVTIDKVGPVNIGDDVAITCTAKDVGYFTVMKWTKKVGDQEMEIGVNDFINHPFKDTNRYTANRNYDANIRTITGTLKITGRLKFY